MTRPPHLVHLTAGDVDVDWLLPRQLQAFRDDGFEVTVVSAPGSHGDTIRAAGIRHVPVPALSRRVGALTDVRAARELKDLLDRMHPEILHTHSPRPGVLGRVLGRRTRVPVVVNTVHGLPAQSTDGLHRRAAGYAVEALALRFSDMELVQNVEDVPILRHLGASREKLIHLGDGVDLERFSQTVATRARAMRLRRSLHIAPGAIVVGMVAPLVWEEGYREFCSAVADLHRAGYQHVNFVVAEPNQAAKLHPVDASTIAEMAALGIHMLGHRDDCENVYAALDILALPSHREGVPHTAMEASAMGIPVIATNLRGPRQVVVDGLSGLLVPVRESRPLARAIAQLADAPTTRKAMGIAGARRAKQRFDQNRIIDLTLGVYRAQLRSAGLDGPPSQPVINLRNRDSISLVDDRLATESAVFAGSELARKLGDSLTI